MEKEYRVCSLCRERFYGYGHNPEPIKRFEERCCDDCNARYVLQARIRYITEQYKKEHGIS